jgi:hypothetical protein
MLRVQGTIKASLVWVTDAGILWIEAVVMNLHGSNLVHRLFADAEYDSRCHVTPQA